jgi:glycosyltransferase involved in cell wall biosynthesis
LQGGAGAYSRILARTLVQQGHEVFVFSSVQAGCIDPQVTLTNSVHRWNYGSLRAINRWARTNQLDIINLQFQTATYQMSPYIHFLPQMTSMPVVTTFHDLRFPYLFPKAGKLRDWIVMHLARCSAGVIVTNHEDLLRIGHLKHWALIPIGSNILTPLPPDFDRQQWREKAAAAPSDFLLAHFGFINRSKGVDVLVQSLAELRDAQVPVRLLMIGGRTGTSDPTNVAYADEIDSLIAEYALTLHIHWTDFVDDSAVSAYLAASDAVALPYWEGASYRRGSLMAAIHHGCAIITTMPQVPIPTFVDEENMLLVRPGESLADAIRRLIAQPELREQLRKGALELSRHFDWSQIARDCVSFFQKVIS